MVIAITTTQLNKAPPPLTCLNVCDVVDETPREFFTLFTDTAAAAVKS